MRRVIVGVLVIIAIVVACSQVTNEVAPDPTDGFTALAEKYCKDHPTYPCGHVYLCKGTPTSNALGFWETCVLDTNSLHEGNLDQAEARYGQCEPTPRHEGLCLWGCIAGWIGCNALNGCTCPPPPPTADAGVDGAPTDVSP